MREALARLSGVGLVRLTGQKGFRVAPISHTDLRDITKTRQIVEAQALRLAIEAADDNWEAEILNAHDLMRLELGRRAKGSDVWLDAFEARHEAFHQALIATCPLESLKSFCHDLYLRKERYRRVLLSYAFTRKDVITEHESLMQAVLSRDHGTARRALVAHIGLTADLLVKLLPKTNCGE